MPENEKFDLNVIDSFLRAWSVEPEHMQMAIRTLQYEDATMQSLVRWFGRQLIVVPHIDGSFELVGFQDHIRGKTVRQAADDFFYRILRVTSTKNWTFDRLMSELYLFLTKEWKC